MGGTTERSKSECGIDGGDGGDLPVTLNVDDEIQLATGGVEAQTWRVLRRLGNGNFGVVYAIGRRGCVGALKTGIGEGGWQTAWEGFVLKRLSDLGHTDNLIKFLGSGSSRDKKGKKFDYLAVEILHPTCPTLSALVKHYPGRMLEVGKATRIGMMMLRGIYAMHSVGLLHRDVKPDNVGILPAPNEHICVLLDMGMARFFTDAAGELRDPRTYPGQKGTPSFMSQRVVSWRESGRVDDLWSWFFTLVELMKGEMHMPWDELGFVDDKYEPNHIRLKARDVAADILLKGLPTDLYAVRLHLVSLNFEDPPDYEFLFNALGAILDNVKTAYPNEPLVPIH